MNKIRLSEVATVELSSIDKKIEASEIPVKLCNFTDVYYNWSITKNVVDACMDGSVNDTEYSKFSLKKGSFIFDCPRRWWIKLPNCFAF